VRDAIEPCPLAFLAEEGALAAEHVATVVAHPDDETLGCGALLPRLKGVTLVHVTDGAPRNMDDGATHGFASPEAYAAARRAELEAAVALAGIGPDALVGLGVPDQGAAFRLPDLARGLAALFRERGVRLVLTHAYEGGHPDHDAVAFAAQAARRLLLDETREAPPQTLSPLAALAAKGERVEASSPEIAVVEMPFYHASPSGWTTQRFIPDPEQPELVIWLDAGQRELKRRMLAAHATQAATLAGFTLDFERFRLAPDYDFTALPNGGDLLYERYDWGLTGARWRTLARAALNELGLEQAA
jgi:N-acetylglucosamine malate deacetylase 2